MSIFKRSPARLAARRVVPGLFAVELANGVRQHWQDQLSARQRKRFVALIRKSGGRPSNLTPKQRKELFSLVRSFDPVALAKRELRTTAGLKTPSKRFSKA